jgi:hypothetical protein
LCPAEAAAAAAPPDDGNGTPDGGGNTNQKVVVMGYNDRLDRIAKDEAQPLVSSHNCPRFLRQQLLLAKVLAAQLRVTRPRRYRFTPVGAVEQPSK